MKNRILTFIIGILVGAIMATSGFLIYNKSINNNQNEMMKPFENNGQMQRPNGNIGEPPEKPQGAFQPTMPNNNI